MKFDNFDVLYETCDVFSQNKSDKLARQNTCLCIFIKLHVQLSQLSFFDTISSVVRFEAF